jgi:glycosyltransferase involved in cell wall biosynthesis
MSSEPASAVNPYFRLFYDALRPLGVELAGTFVPSRRWLRENAESFEALHFHWPEWIIRSEPDSFRFFHAFRGGWRISQLLAPAYPAVQIREYRAFLRAARAARKRIVWTCHNVEAHEDATGPVRSAYRTLARAADLVICHDAAAGARCSSLYAPRGRIAIMEHGNYDGVYPAARPKAEVLRELGISPGVPLLLFVGQVRPYKAVDLICDVAARLGEGTALLIAGHSPIADYAREIRERVARLPNAVFVDRHLSEQEFADYTAASDLVLLPYRKVTGSGSALAALTLGRGLIASDLPFFVDLLRGHPDAGRVFRCGDAKDLTEAIAAFLRVPSAVRERAARELAARYDWARLVPPVAAILRELASQA